MRRLSFKILYKNINYINKYSNFYLNIFIKKYNINSCFYLLYIYKQTKTIQCLLLIIFFSIFFYINCNRDQYYALHIKRNYSINKLCLTIKFLLNQKNKKYYLVIRQLDPLYYI